MALLDRLLGKSPAQAAQPYLEQIPEAVSPYYQPYMQAGGQALQSAQSQFQNLAENPQDFYKELLAGYKESPGYAYKENKLLQTARNAAAAGGRAGTMSDQMQQQELVNSLLGSDLQNYLENILGIQKTGLSGEQNLANLGYGASTGYGDILGSSLGSQAGLAYQGQAQQRSDLSSLLGSLIRSAPELIPLLK